MVGGQIAISASAVLSRTFGLKKINDEGILNLLKKGEQSLGPFFPLYIILQMMSSL
jgi:hypothetical protein